VFQIVRAVKSFADDVAVFANYQAADERTVSGNFFNDEVLLSVDFDDDFGDIFRAFDGKV